MTPGLYRFKAALACMGFERVSGNEKGKETAWVLKLFNNPIKIKVQVVLKETIINTDHLHEKRYMDF